MTEVRATPNREIAADWWVSPEGGGTVMAAVRNALVTTAIQTFEADGLSQGWMGKAAMCLSTCF
jgi:hypothetical protein